ncbi:MAG: 2-hydroxychromene-2-carboxylate isomerase [Alphaproteobacteria bacterium MarineAlpha3_Bin5]|nr:MAG: 2-hydroxychromene-2-carboxylate isomerase [Alphaproteobacteria bacterium MarineAlpha3_Bin5]
MKNSIEFYFDFSSAYSYFAASKIDDLAVEFERPVIWKPFMLGAAMKLTGNVPLTEQPIKREYCKNDWIRLAKFQGLPWILPKNFPIATVAAARGFYWIDQTNSSSAKQFARGCFHKYFGEGIDISKLEIIADIAESEGFARSAFLSAIQEPHIKKILKEKTDEAIKRGMFGAPFFVVGNEMFWGADRLWMLRHWLKRESW